MERFPVFHADQFWDFPRLARLFAELENICCDLSGRLTLLVLGLFDRRGMEAQANQKIGSVFVSFKHHGGGEPFSCIAFRIFGMPVPRPSMRLISFRKSPIRRLRSRRVAKGPSGPVFWGQPWLQTLLVSCVANPADGCAGFACATRSLLAPAPRSPAISRRPRELPRRLPQPGRVSGVRFCRRLGSRLA